jgi:hypothetical protein
VLSEWWNSDGNGWLAKAMKYFLYPSGFIIACSLTRKGKLDGYGLRSVLSFLSPSRPVGGRERYQVYQYYRGCPLSRIQRHCWHMVIWFVMIAYFKRGLHDLHCTVSFKIWPTVCCAGLSINTSGMMIVVGHTWGSLKHRIVPYRNRV